MKCNLILQINEVTIRNYTIIEDEGIGNLVTHYPELKMSYEDDEEMPGMHVIVISAPDPKPLLKFLDFSELSVRILT